MNGTIENGGTALAHFLQRIRAERGDLPAEAIAVAPATGLRVGREEPVTSHLDWIGPQAERGGCQAAFHLFGNGFEYRWSHGHGLVLTTGPDGQHPMSEARSVYLLDDPGRFPGAAPLVEELGARACLEIRLFLAGGVALGDATVGRQAIEYILCGFRPGARP